MCKVATVALGACADPVTHVTPVIPGVAWSDIHLAAALLGLVLFVGAFYLQWANICANQVLINQLVQQVRQIRREKGLDADVSEYR